MIKKTDIQALADLSRISVSEEEQESLAGDLENILAYVSELKEAEVGDGSENETALVRNVMRADEPTEDISTPEDILNEAPKTKNGFVVVKKILN